MAKRRKPSVEKDTSVPFIKTITVNRKAWHDYKVLETVEAGVILTGTEIKSIRDGRVNIREAFARSQQGELWLLNCHISPYSAGSIHNHDPVRPRKLLLHREQMASLIGKAAQKGYTIVPLRLYIKRHVAKVELGLGQGRRRYDKRRELARRADERDMERAVKQQR